jgi:hypothetical protein
LWLCCCQGNKAKTVAPKPVKPRNEFIDLAPYREMYARSAETSLCPFSSRQTGVVATVTHRYNSETGKNVRKVGAVAILFGLSQISTCVPSSRVSVHACNRMYRLRTTSCAALARFFLPP